MSVILESYKGPGIGEDGAKRMLDSLAQSRELKPFAVLLEQMRQTNLGKNWRPDESLLSALVKESRKDFLEVLLADGLDLKQLQALQKDSDSEMSAWIAKRVAETEKQRADLKKLVDACAKGNLAAAKELLNAGVDVNGRLVDGSSWTPLTRAAADNKVEVVKLLLERGAKPDLVKYPGWDYTPLCLTSSVEIANLLKAAGANVHATLFKRNTSILTYAAEFNGAPMVQWFLDQGLDPKMIGDNDETLLFGVKDKATAEILLKAGVDPNRPDEFGSVPLQQARNAGVVEALLKAGAKMDGLKRPLIPGMIQFSKADAVEAALKAGAPQDYMTLQDALIRAAHMDQDKTVEVLLKYGASANDPGEWSGPDDTLLPLKVCCIFGHPKTAKVLLAHGADPNKTSGRNAVSMLQVAIHNQYKELAKILKEAGAKGVPDLTFAVAMEDSKRKAELLASAPDFKSQPQFWEGALPAAAERGDLATVEAALSKGVPVILSGSGATYAPRDDGYYSAAFQGQWEVLQALIQARDPKADPKELEQALWAAVWNSHPYPKQRSAPNFEKCVQLLIAAGAPVRATVKPEKGRPNYDPLPSAIFTRNPGGNPKVIEMLVEAGADPNPDIGEGKRLMDVVGESCKTKSCATPNEEILSTLEKLTKKKVDRPK